ncbi:MAG: hypothetical protein CMJ83_07150 [Planctomycetes bacterium]|nr:hypothetical protein [Planctomycetota bacterium]
MLASGLRFEVAAQPGQTVKPRLELKFRGAFRSGMTSLDPSDIPPSANGLKVAYERGTMVERYEVGVNAIEQSFEFASEPSGSGDLVIAFDVLGNVRAPALDHPRHGALEFSFEGVRSIRYGEAYGIDRSGRRVLLATAWDGVGRLELIVPADLLESATYPLLIDPAIGPTINVGGASFNDVNPDVAHDPEQRTWLVVWQRVFSTDSDIRAALYDEDGTAISSSVSFESSPSRDAKDPSVAFFRGNGNVSNNRFLIAWSESAAGGTTYGIKARLARADDGFPAASTFAVTSPALGVKDSRPDVAGGPPMLVAWDRTAAGETSPRSLHYRTLHWPNPSIAAAVTVESERTLTTVGSGNVRDVRLAQSSLTLLVGASPWSIWRATWARFFPTPAPGDADIYTTSFRTVPGLPGSTVIEPLSTVPNAATVGSDEISPDIALMASSLLDVSGAHYLIAWQDEAEIRGQMYDTNGPMGGGIIIQPAAGTAHFQPAVGAGACEFTVAYLEAGPGEFNLDVYGARVLPDGSVPANHRLIDNPGTTYQEHVRNSSRPLTLSSANRKRNTSLVTWMGQTGPAGGGLNDVRARFFEPLAAGVSPFGAGCAGPTGLVPVIGIAGGLPHPGNRDFAITLSNAPSSAVAILALSTTAASLPIPGAPGCVAYGGPPYLFLPTVTSPTGTASIPLSIPCTSALLGAFVPCQWAIATPGFNAAGLIVSDDIDVSWFH